MSRAIPDSGVGSGAARTITSVDASAFGVAPFDSAWLTALTQLAGLVIAVVLCGPGQQRILRAWWQTVKGYGMSDTGAAQ